MFCIFIENLVKSTKLAPLVASSQASTPSHVGFPRWVFILLAARAFCRCMGPVSTFRRFHIQKKKCASCGYPAAKMRKYNWSVRKGQFGASRTSKRK